MKLTRLPKVDMQKRK